MATATKTSKAPAIRHESTKQNPVAFVWAFAAKNHKKMGRAETCRQLEKMGIAHYTARTQYQRAYSAGFPKAKPAPKAAK